MSTCQIILVKPDWSVFHENGRQQDPHCRFDLREDNDARIIKIDPPFIQARNICMGTWITPKDLPVLGNMKKCPVFLVGWYWKSNSIQVWCMKCPWTEWNYTFTQLEYFQMYSLGKFCKERDLNSFEKH